MIAAVLDVYWQISRGGSVDGEGESLERSQGRWIGLLEGDGTGVRMQFVEQGLRYSGQSDQFTDVGWWESPLESSVVLSEEHGGGD